MPTTRWADLMVHDDGKDYEARLAALATEFARTLPDKRAALAAEWNDWRAGDPEARARLQAVVHRLGGAADNYGYVAVGEAARRLDALLIPRLGALPDAVEPALAALLHAFGLPPEPI